VGNLSVDDTCRAVIFGFLLSVISITADRGMGVHIFRWG